MTTIEERFQAAVNVIKGLPKNGPYQPSTAMMLKFYGYYKQATEGPCPQKKPPFWDIVGKAKWDAWNFNRYLTKQQAMHKYVEELRGIIETMSFTENVQSFVGSINSLDNINLNELEMVAPGMRELAESHPNSPFNSRTNSPHHEASANSSVDEEDGTTDNKKYHANYVNCDISGSDLKFLAQKGLTKEDNMTTSNRGTIDQSDDEYADPIDLHNDFNDVLAQNFEVLKQIQTTVLRMNADLITMNKHVQSLEKVVEDMHSSGKKLMSNAYTERYPKWWPFENISPVWFTLLILWPFLVNRLSRLILGSKRK